MWSGIVVFAILLFMHDTGTSLPALLLRLVRSSLLRILLYICVNILTVIIRVANNAHRLPSHLIWQEYHLSLLLIIAYGCRAAAHRLALVREVYLLRYFFRVIHFKIGFSIAGSRARRHGATGGEQSTR